MIFYDQNIEHDRCFLELQTQLNLSYWIAADINHYYEISKANVNSYEYKRLLAQYQIAINICKRIDIDSSNTGANHKSCLKVLKKFIEYCFIEFDFSRMPKLKDSESEETGLLHMNDIETAFQKTYMEYLHPAEMENYMLKSFVFFGQGCESIMYLSSEIEFGNQEKIENLSNETIKNFRLARFELETVLKDPHALECMLDEFIIIIGNKNLNENAKEFIELNFNYLKLWKEYYLTHEKYCEEILINRDNEEDVESDLFEFECNNYLSYINIMAIKINLFILNNMQVDIPNIEIYSQRLIRSPIDYIQNRRN